MQRSPDVIGGEQPQPQDAAPHEAMPDVPAPPPGPPPGPLPDAPVPDAPVPDAPVPDPPAPDPPAPPLAAVPDAPAPPPPRPTLTDLLNAYEAAQPADPAHGRAALEHAIEASPVLKTKLQEAIAAGHLDSFRFVAADDGAGGSYSPTEKSLNLNAGSFRGEANLVFVLGHETQHALSLQGLAPAYDTALTAAIAVRADNNSAPASRAAPRDYTDVVRDVVEGTRREEAQAHIGGFNALASYVRHERHLDRAPTTREMYETAPGRMSDFINVTGMIWKDYTMKPGLAREADGTMALSDENINRMKVYYADKFPGTFGPNGLMDYRNQAIFNAWKEIHTAETGYGQHRSILAASAATGPDGQLAPDYAPVQHAYKIDFAALGASPAILKFPAGGIVDVVDTNYAVATRLQSGAPMEDPEIQALRAAVDPTLTAAVARPDAMRALGRRNAIDLPAEVDAPAPEPALLQQSKQALATLGADGGLDDPKAFANAAAALAAEAQKSGLSSIDHVVKSTTGDRLIAVQGQDPATPDARLAAVELAQAVKQPAEQSLQALQGTPAPTPTVDPQQQGKSMSM
jgi:hypothetical protein